jgi:hypothetical protein
MSVTNEKLSGLALTSTTTGGRTYIILPDGIGGFDSYQIQVKDISVSDASVKYLAQSTSFTVAILADSWINFIYFNFVSGTPNVKIGTSAGGTQVMATQVITDETYYYLTKKYAANTTLYFTITGGVIDIRIDMRNNFIAS